MPRAPRRDIAAALPDFPWDLLAPHKSRAAAHPAGMIDLSMGSPVDSVAGDVQAALATAADAPSYPLTHGTPAFRSAVSAWMSDALGVRDYPSDAVLPTIGSKEAVGWLPFMLGFGAGHTVIAPTLAYPTYEVGALTAGCTFVRADNPDEWPAGDIAMVWLNSPSNPTGAVRPATQMKRVVDAARERGAIVASDECYIELTWGTPATSVLADSVSHGDHTGLLALHSLSKRSNLAGYRVATITGDPAVVSELLNVRKQLGHLVPAPVLAAATIAYQDREHAGAQKDVYGRRRQVLSQSLAEAGFTFDPSAGSLFIWATCDRDAWETTAALAELGILVAPGIFYGAAGNRHVRLALTATDAGIEDAANRLQSFA